jgi:hypothetical protein
VKAQEDGTQVTEILFAHNPSWLRGPVTRLLGSRRVHARTKTVLLLTPLLVPLVFILPLQMVRSGANSVLDVLRHGVQRLHGRFFALVSLFVAAALIIVGITLINANETRLLAGSVDVYWSLDGLVFTRQLMSLSLSLGAFASFFLIAAQQQDARTLFMAKILARARRSLLVYTIYCHAHEHATEWTGIEVHSVLAPPAPESRDGR